MLIHASQYIRRVVESLDAYPFKILLLVKSAACEVCSVRQMLARDILNARLSELDIVPRKVRSLFPSELKVAAATGTLPPRLDLNLRHVSRVWKADTRENERVPLMLFRNPVAVCKCSVCLVELRFVFVYVCVGFLNNAVGLILTRVDLFRLLLIVASLIH